MKKGLCLDVPWRVRSENLGKDFFCRLHQALSPARLLRLEAVHVHGKLAGTFDVREIEKFPAFELRSVGKVRIFGQRIVLPPACRVDRGAAPNSRSAVEIEKGAAAR